ncbi:hypothetical protein ACTJKC_14785 [Pedobacter sp. 22226]|uniref:hypothetical protein n=1 Tax=Pedobacter sp. 22226 TaxID=3453894 RepID=UPI003F867B25
MKISIGSLPPWGSFFWFGPKETKTQGLDLMSDKFVKAFKSSAQAPDEGSGRACCLGIVIREKGVLKL